MDTDAGDRRTQAQALRDGFRFGNRFEYTWRWPSGRPAKRVVYGLCGGMCYAALDYLAAGMPIPEEHNPPVWGEPLHQFLLRRQWDSWRWLGVPLRTLYWMLLSDRQVARRTLKRELPQVLARLDAGRPQVLLLLRSTGADPTVNHQVVATGYRRDTETGQVTLYLYDPNHPGREPTLTVDTTGASSPLVQQSTGEPLAGFYIIGYRPRTPRVPGPREHIPE